MFAEKMVDNAHPSVTEEEIAVTSLRKILLQKKIYQNHVKQATAIARQVVPQVK